MASTDDELLAARRQAAEGRLDEAEQTCQRFLRDNPRHAEARCGLGEVLAMQCRHSESVSQYVEAIVLKHDYTEAKKKLDSEVRLVKTLADAGAIGTSGLGLGQEIVNTLVSAARQLTDAGRSSDAVTLCELALSISPNRVDVLAIVASIRIDLGDFDEAVERLEEALRAMESYAPAYQLLGDLALQNRYRFSEDKLQHMRTMLSDERVPQKDKSVLHITLGGLLDKQGRYDEAFQCYELANIEMQRTLELSKNSFDSGQYARTIDETISVFGNSFFKGSCHSALETELPIFIVGMPRSGTTLVEQILSSHPEVSGAGESQYIAQLALELPDIVGGDQQFPGCMTRADATVISNLADRHLRRLSEQYSSAKRVVDKTPLNFLFLGFIAALFPQAHVIHCQRDAMDVCLSCYLQCFKNVTWASRLEDIGFVYRHYLRLMDHWRDCLPLRMYEISYEELIVDQETLSRELIGFCGLDWDEVCLEFHKNRGAVRTASRVQVRQPIYSTSIGRWKRYQHHLAPLQKAIDCER